MPKSRKRKSDFAHLYLPPVQSVVFHENDRDLDQIIIKLPAPPPLHEIDGYGLHPKDQKFTRQEMPPRLSYLNSKRFKDVEEYWRQIVEDWDYYKSEMWFIDQEWERRKKGYWFYNNGVPTWITGRHYMHIRWFEAENKSGARYQDYRDRDRKFYTALWWCENTTEAPFRYKITVPDRKTPYYTSSEKRKEELVKNRGAKVETGEPYFLVDMGQRTVIGMTWNKMRREGATTKAKNVELDIATSTPMAKCGTQSATLEHAEKVYKDILLRGWRGYPFFFKPLNENNPDPAQGLKMKPQSKKGKTGSKEEIQEALYSQITYKASTENAYDGEQMEFLHNDECGKTKEVDVERRWMKFQKQTLTLGANKNIEGLAICTTTVGDMVKEGGEKWKQLCMNSHWRQRNDMGQTQTGLVNFFIDSVEGLEGCVDEYGNSQIAKAEDNINTQIAQFIESGNEEGLIDFKKDVPRCFRDCFAVLTGNKRFPMEKINTRLNEFLFNENPKLIYGKLEYVNWPNWTKKRDQRYLIQNLPTAADILSGIVRIRFVPTDKTDYDWIVSDLPEAGMECMFYKDHFGEIHPANCSTFSQGADTFKVGEATTSGKSSNGAGAIFRKFNPGIDSFQYERNQRNPETGEFYHKTGVFNAIYNKLPADTDEYCEQQLMASIFWGCKCFPEINLTEVWRWYARRGFINYLQFRIDMKTGKELKQPGFHTGGTTRDSIFNKMRDYLNMSALIENHLILLEQCRDIDLKMSDFDVFVACGFALLAASEDIKEFVKIEAIDISQLFPRFKLRR